MSAPLPKRIDQIDPNEAWQPWTPSDRQPWNTKWAAHLHRRAGFGASTKRVSEAVRLGLSPALKRVFEGEANHDKLDAVLDELGAGFAKNTEPSELRAWWVYRMLNGGHPLREKLTLFWHDHFATSIAKVRSGTLMFRQNQLLRTHALGKFGPMLAKMSEDPAMLVWLDSNDNHKDHPNENFAREVMELFSLGVGNFTEKDIQEAARAFTGWFTNPQGTKFDFDKDAHDFGQKTVLGQRGNWNGQDIIRIVLDRPIASEFLVEKLYREFVSESAPPRGLIEPLVRRFRESNYDIEDITKTILASRLFFSQHAFRKKIKTPVEFVLGTVQAAWPGTVTPQSLDAHITSMGQELFSPPNVAGWPGGRNWLNTATVLARNEFANDVAMGEFVNPSISSPDGALLGAVAGPTLPSPQYLEHPPQYFEPTGLLGLVNQRLHQKYAELNPTFPAPNKDYDVAKRFDNIDKIKPSALVARLVDQFLPGGIAKEQAKKIEAHLTEGKPNESELRHRLRESAHALMCTAEYQLG